MTRALPLAALALLAASLSTTRAARAQDAATATPVSREQAARAALERGARLGVARADTLAAFAQLLTARAFENPVASFEYTKSAPRYHATVDLPLDYPWLRRTRIASASAARDAAQLRFAFERAAIVLDVDTTYTLALAARERANLSRRNAEDADSLRRMAVARRDAGDASDLDVELASVNAGQQANVAAADSLALVGALLDLQTVMGLAAGRVEVTPSDSLTVPPADTAGLGASAARFVSAPAPLAIDASATNLAGDASAPSAAPLSVAAAQATLSSTELATRAQRRSVFGIPSITFGFETGDPSGDEPGVLPIVGVALPLPLFNRNKGPIAQATAERDRARAELALAQVESRIAIARALRERSTALAKVERDRALLAGAERVAAMSLTAYREGAASLPNVLEAQRNARDVRAQYVDDLAQAWIATATLRVVTLTPAASASIPSPTR